MKKRFWIGISFALFLMAACGSEEAAEAPQTSEEPQASQETQDVKEIVHEYSVGDFEDVSASITSDELIITDADDKETTYELPEDEFFVSIAPFIEETHPCEIHSLTGCQGELVEEEFDVYIEDEEGNVIVDETLKSLENGFIDLWLPKNETFQVTIKHDGKTAEQEITTFEGDNTCITTMQLI